MIENECLQATRLLTSLYGSTVLGIPALDLCDGNYNTLLSVPHVQGEHRRLYGGLCRERGLL